MGREARWQHFRAGFESDRSAHIGGRDPEAGIAAPDANGRKSVHYALQLSEVAIALAPPLAATRTCPEQCASNSEIAE